MKATKIVCTLGPASSEKQVMKDMLAAGMNVARFNFSHGSHEEHAEKMKTFREACKDQKPENKLGFTPLQRFFIAYACTWAENCTDETVLQQTKSDEHSLSRLRVNGALPHIDEWYQAFGITEQDSMYIAPNKRVRIW